MCRFSIFLLGIQCVCLPWGIIPTRKYTYAENQYYRALLGFDQQNDCYLVGFFSDIGAGPVVKLFYDMFVILHFFQGYEFELQLSCIEI